MPNAKALDAQGRPQDLYVAEDPWCGEFVSGLLGPDLNGLIVTHFAMAHPDITVVVEGIHYIKRPKPLSCDICHGIAELPYWTHVSSPPTNTATCVDRDGRWLVCDPCHDLVIQRKPKLLIDRVMNSPRTLGVLKDPQFKDSEAMHVFKTETRITMTLLVANLDDGERNTVENPGPLGTDPRAWP